MKLTARVRSFAFSLASLSVLALSIAPAGTALAQANYVKLVIAFPAGGPSDILARTLSEQLGKELGQNVIVENRPGGNGAVAALHVANSPPDGKTLWLTTAGAITINPELYPKLAYDVNDFASVSLVVDNQEILVVNPKDKANDAAEFVRNAKEKKEPVSIASSGIGSMPHMAVGLLTDATHVPFLHVPMKGAAPAITDVMGGHVQGFFGDIPGILAQIRAGSLKPIGIAAPKRHPLFPDVKTFEEQGIKGFDLNNWSAIVVSRQVPAPVVDKLNKAIRRALENPALLENLRSLGMDPRASTPAELDALVASDRAKWKRVIQVNNIQPE